MLVNNNFLISKDFILDLLYKKITIFTFDIKILALIKPYSQFILKRVLTIKNFIILP